MSIANTISFLSRQRFFKWMTLGPGMRIRGVAWLVCVVFGLSALRAVADVVELVAVADTTIFQDYPSNGNGAAPFSFAGNNAGASTRRALVRFDLSSLPPGATIQAASLKLEITKAGILADLPPNNLVMVHRLTQSWGEGSANGGATGFGAAASPNDATWPHRFFGNGNADPLTGGTAVPWSTPGGDFLALPSATTIGNGLGTLLLSGAGLVADVQAWQQMPQTNFGWIVRSSETRLTARQFASRESTNVSIQPRLIVTFTPIARLVPASVDPIAGVQPDLEIRVAGSAAEGTQFAAHPFERICSPATASTFLNPSDERAVFCEVEANQVVGGWPDDAPSKRVLFRHSGFDDDRAGVGSVCETQTRAFLRLDASCLDTNNDGVYQCGAMTDVLVPHIGLSQVGPSEMQSNATSACGNNKRAAYSLIYGLPVSIELYEALQTAQGLAVDPTPVIRDPVTGAVLDLGINAEPSNVPSFSSAQLRSLLTGRIKNWSQLKVGSSSLVTYPGVQPPSDASLLPQQLGGADNVTLCRRSEASGEHAAYAVHMLRRGCLAGALTGASNATTGPAVAQLANAPNVETCFDKLQQRAGLTVADVGVGGSLPTFFRPSTWAIGQLTTLHNADQSAAYAFVRLDGALPTLLNAASGHYEFVLHASIHRAKDVAYGAGAVLDPALDGGNGGDHRPTLEEVDRMVDALQRVLSPAEIASLNVVHPWGASGVLAPGEVHAIDHDNDDLWEIEHPVWPYTRTVASAFNNCLGPYLQSDGRTELGPFGDNVLTN